MNKLPDDPTQEEIKEKCREIRQERGVEPHSLPGDCRFRKCGLLGERSFATEDDDLEGCRKLRTNLGY